MNIIVTVALYFFAAMEIVGGLVTVSTATKARPDLEPGGACMGAVLLAGLVVAPAGLFLTPGLAGVIYLLAGWLALSVLYDLAQFVRTAHGVRGGKTPLSTFLHVLSSMVNVVVVAYILVRG